MRTIIPIIICFLAFSCKTDNSAYEAYRLNEEASRLFEAGKTEEAIKLYSQATSYTAVHDSIRVIYYANLANAYKSLNNKDSARFYYKKAIQISPKGSVDYYTNHAQISLLDTLAEKALYGLEKAYQLNPNNSTANNLLGIIYLGQYNMELYDPQKALPFNIKTNDLLNDVNAKIVLAKNYYYLEMVEKAVALFKEMHRDYPDDVEYLFVITMMEQELGNEENVNYYLEKLKPLSQEKYEELINNPVEPGHHTIVWE